MQLESKAEIEDRVWGQIHKVFPLSHATQDLEANVSNNTDRKRAILKENAELHCISNFEYFSEKSSHDCQIACFEY